MEYVIFALAVGAVYALMAVGFALVFSILSFSNFSHGVVMCCGAYIGYFLMQAGLPWIVALLGAIVGCGLLGMAIEFLAFRKLRVSNGPLIYLFVAGITVLMLVENVLSLNFGGASLAYPGIFANASITVGTVNLPISYLLMFCISLGSLLLLNWFLQKTKQGIGIRAAATDLKTCALMGIRVNLLISLVFFIAGAVGGCAGVFLGMTYTVYPQLGRLVTKAYMAVVIGGLGSLSGAVIGAFLLAAVETVITLTLGSSATPIGLFLIVVLFLLFRPQGIAGVSKEQKV